MGCPVLQSDWSSHLELTEMHTVAFATSPGIRGTVGNAACRHYVHQHDQQKLVADSSCLQQIRQKSGR